MKETPAFTGKRLCPFIQKLWRIINDNTLHSTIHWSAQGTTICIVNSKQFCESILPRYFKHNNWQSFVRQLNLYGFRKVYHFSIATDYVNGRQEISWQFKHHHFQENRAESLFLIQRKIPTCSLRPDSDARLNDVLPDIIHQLERTERQNAEMRKETQWLREQQEKQQHMVAMLLKRASLVTQNLHLPQSNLNLIIQSDQFNNGYDSINSISSSSSSSSSSSNDSNDRSTYKSRISLPPLATLLKK